MQFLFDLKRNFLLRGERLRAALQYEVPESPCGTLRLAGTSVNCNVDLGEAVEWDPAGTQPYVGRRHQQTTPDNGWCFVSACNRTQLRNAFDLVEFFFS